MQAMIEVIDLFYMANQRNQKNNRIPDSDFYNHALNNDVDLVK